MSLGRPADKPELDRSGVCTEEMFSNLAREKCPGETQALNRRGPRYEILRKGCQPRVPRGEGTHATEWQQGAGPRAAGY